MSRNNGSKWRLAQVRASGVERRLRELSRGGGFSPPVVATDPPASSGVRLWMFADGRLRGRRADTGAVVEYATTTPGPASGPALPEEWTTYPITQQRTFPASWAASYGVDGGRYEPPGFFGNGVVAALGWDVAAIGAALAGAEEVTGVALTLHTAALAQGAAITLGLYRHAAASPPATRPGAVGDRVAVTAEPVGTATVELDPGPWGEPVVPGGVLIDQGFHDALAGRVGIPEDGPLYAPTLTITYRAVDAGAEGDV